MSLLKTIAGLKRSREAFTSATLSPPAPGRPDRLQDFDAAFPNPGNLRARCHVPDGLASPAALLVVLHGCTQDAAGYDQGAGWSVLAERHGFALLYPEQKRENNPNLCFNWYQPADARRGGGEAASIAGMVAAMQAAHHIDPDRIFVTGLSAGGAMAAVMLATYPELFAGGAIIAGMPYGCASNLPQAFDLMAGRGIIAQPGALADKVRAASRHRGRWPRLSVWQGSADRIVSPANSDALVTQWAGLHGLGARPDRVERVDGHLRRVWLGREGEELIEQINVKGMAHGTPLMPGTGDGQSGEARAHMLDVGLSSTDRIAAFFGIGPEVAARSVKAKEPTPEPRRTGREDPASGPPSPGQERRLPATPAFGAQRTIEDALRSAGLMK